MIFLPPLHFIWRLALICLLTLLLIIVGCFMSCRQGAWPGKRTQKYFYYIYLCICLFIVCECACLCVSICVCMAYHVMAVMQKTAFTGVSSLLPTFGSLGPLSGHQVWKKEPLPMGPSHLPFQVFLTFVSFTPSARCGPWKDSHWPQEGLLKFLAFIVLEIEISTSVRICMFMYI